MENRQTANPTGEHKGRKMNTPKKLPFMAACSKIPD